MENSLGGFEVYSFRAALALKIYSGRQEDFKKGVDAESNPETIYKGYYAFNLQSGQ